MRQNVLYIHRSNCTEIKFVLSDKILKQITFDKSPNYYLLLDLDRSLI